MHKFFALPIGALALFCAAPASAQHLANLNTPFPRRGECESSVADWNSNVRDILVTNFPFLFDSEGDAASYLTRAFPCELSAVDGNWYIKDRRAEVINSDWFDKK